MTAEREAIKNLIAEHESNGDYNTVFGGGKQPITSMTVKEVLDWQAAQRKGGARSTAVGKYQFINKTLKSIVDRNPKDFPKDRLFDEAAQEEAADILLNRRGFKAFEEGKLSAEKVANNLAKEWASLPVVSGKKKGSSYYDSKLNKALTSPEAVLDALTAPKQPSQPTQEAGSWADSILAADAARQQEALQQAPVPPQGPIHQPLPVNPPVDPYNVGGLRMDNNGKGMLSF